MKKVIKLLFAAIAVTGVMASCGGDGKNEGTGTLILSVEPDFMNNTSVIVNSGTDYAEFFTTYNGNPVTASLKMNGANFTGDDFSTTTAGTYKFKAEYDGATSNEVTVIAAEQDDLVLLSDKTTEDLNSSRRNRYGQICTRLVR